MFKLDIADADTKILLRILEEIQDIAPILGELGEVAVASIQRSFQLGGRYGSDNPFGGGSTTWVPSIRSREQGGTTLSDTNTLSNSVTYQIESKDTLRVGSNIRYGAIHHFGGTIEPRTSPFLMFRLANGQFVKTKKVEIPARPWVTLQNEDLEEFAHVIIEYYQKLLTQ